MSLRRLIDVLTKNSWFEHAKCSDYDPELFFPPKDGEDNNGGMTAYARAKAAKAVCNGDDETGEVCPVREQCLTYALEANEKFGVWGGMSEQERAKYRREMRARARRAEQARQQEIEARTTVVRTGRRVIVRREVKW